MGGIYFYRDHGCGHWCATSNWDIHQAFALATGDLLKSEDEMENSAIPAFQLSITTKERILSRQTLHPS